MCEETFLLVGVAIVTPQIKLWEDQIIIVMPYWFINYDLAPKQMQSVMSGQLFFFLGLWLVGLIYESSHQKLG